MDTEGSDKKNKKEYVVCIEDMYVKSFGLNYEDDVELCLISSMREVKVFDTLREARMTSSIIERDTGIRSVIKLISLHYVFEAESE